MKYEYPQELPVSAAHDEIAAAVSASQVVIVSGQTGSGKTTQIPKILLEMGRGTHGHQIVHTQPRRIAARTVAERIASEMEVRLGDEIGYQVRFTDASSPKTRLRIVTDGILLAQIQRDPRLSQYDTIIIDEAHERSLNIDFLLGYLTSLLPQRRDLKLVITSATIDSVKFQHHFEQALHRPVPVIEVSGRTYPVQIVYEPLGSAPALMRHVPGFEHQASDDMGGGTSRPGHAADADMAMAVARACAELVIHASHERGARDILVFASGEHDIREFETALRRHFGPRSDDMRRGDAIEIMPLFARLSSKEQHKVFEPHAHQRIVIATNVAETSLTVPGIRYVVDPGTARISRYSKSAKVQRLPIEPISQASADQRSGRCGRVADGIAIRLYAKDDYETRPRFTEPEILRTSLGAVVLHMLSVGVAKNAGDVTHFGFIDPPDVKAVSDGFTELTELRAVARRHGEMTLTRTGRQLARIPIDIRLGRMLIEAAHATTPNTLAAVLVIVAFLSLQDPRERPDEAHEEADRIHNRYADPSSDFLTALNLWDRVFQADGNPSNGALRRLCKTEYLSFLRLRQWHDLVTQLGDMCHELKFTLGEPQPASRPTLDIRQLPLNQQGAHSLCCSWDAQGIHTAMLAGLLSMIGMQVVREPKASEFTGLKGAAKARAMKRAAKRSHNDYQGARGTRFALFPASAVAKTTPPWVMSTELVETSRLWARYSAAIDPAWAEPLAGSLTRTTYAEPHWSASRGAAVAKAKILLYGLPIVQDRTVQWGRINPVEARDFLIRQGLVEGDIQQRFSYDDFVTHNLDVLHDAAEDTSRTRQAAASVSDEDLYDFYSAVIPTDVTSLADLAKWWRLEHDRHPQLLDFDPEAVERLQTGGSVSLADYPDRWHALGTDGTALDLRLSYVYDPHDPADGVSIHVPITALSRLRPEQFTWNVPGLLDELIVAMIKSLPKALRVQFVPAPDTARAIRAYIDDHYPELPGSGADGQPNIPPAKAQTGIASWPDFTHVFTEAAIHVVGAQIHPQVFEGDQWSKLPAYLRMNFVIEKPHHASSPGRHGAHLPRSANPVTVLGSGRSLVELQRHFAAQAEASARLVVRGQAQSAGAQGRLVEQANLLHKAGATTQSRATMLWQGALDRLRLPSERISSRWLGTEALMLASAPYDSTKALSEDLQLAAVKRLLPDIDQLDDDDALAQAVAGVGQVYEDTVYAVARDVTTILKRYAEVDKAVSGPADLPMLSVLQSVREHIASLVRTGFIGAAPPDALGSFERYLHADLLRLNKAKTDKNRDVRWAWEADEARQLVERFHGKAKAEPAGPRHETMGKRYTAARWLLEEFYVSLWAQELGTAKPVSLRRIGKALEG
ncbi:ATP-dependent RNA helicase HrpA [Bifidobacterium sp.]|jgi:ATP-dependent helicase HrpA|uniref:ATP-dependent RNA helicase HrpA n=1 Tax=Bifidobacterium sp. TaxID=41200 RepID=UPI0025BA32F6|nr:ATP-dependent RNA helicase HrpA [Bifidobacterium sp.]MCH4209281.1 ATP-dependent RNA helicase HrpA [Bifidobacterium sp.]MCI1224075.1 ATP-dependent RNA helicase HrpA [Bifidobacterium sp.]